MKTIKVLEIRVLFGRKLGQIESIDGDRNTDLHCFINCI